MDRTDQADSISSLWSSQHSLALLSSGVCTHPAHMGLTKSLRSLGEGTLCTPARVHVQTCARESLFREKVLLSWKLLLLLIPRYSPSWTPLLPSAAGTSVACLEHAPGNTVCSGKTSAIFTRQHDHYSHRPFVVLSWWSHLLPSLASPPILSQVSNTPSSSSFPVGLTHLKEWRKVERNVK